MIVVSPDNRFYLQISISNPFSYHKKKPGNFCLPGLRQSRHTPLQMVHRSLSHPAGVRGAFITNRLQQGARTSSSGYTKSRLLSFHIFPLLYLVIDIADSDDQMRFIWFPPDNLHIFIDKLS